MAELHDLTAVQQAVAVRAGQVSPVDLVQHYLDRIQAWSSRLGAFVTVTPERALDQARAAEQAVRDGAELAALHGVPTAIKDLTLTAGVPTAFGSAAYSGFVPGIDDNTVTALRRAGTISLGKTNTPEFGLPCYTEPDNAPPARTPWDTDRSAGGSSGGAGAAVAAGLVPFAHGSDGGGSVRIPASVCGLVGIKPTRGRISGGPLYAEVTGLAGPGPLARTVRDAAALLDAMAGPQPGDPSWAPPLPVGETFLAAADRSPGRLRIGRYARPVLNDVSVHPDCLAAWESASALLTELGHDVEDVPPPFEAGLLTQFAVIWGAIACGFPVDREREPLLRPLTRHLRAQGRATSAPDFIEALGVARSASAVAVAATTAYDAVLVPTLAQPPVPVGSLRNDADPVADFAAQAAFSPFCASYNLTGQPAVNLPLHWTDAGLPIGVMLAGRPAAEATLISLSAQLEAARPWAGRRPPQW